MWRIVRFLDINDLIDVKLLDLFAVKLTERYETNLNLFIETTAEFGLLFSFDLCVKGNLEISISVYN